MTPSSSVVLDSGDIGSLLCRPPQGTSHSSQLPDRASHHLHAGPHAVGAAPGGVPARSRRRGVPPGKRTRDGDDLILADPQVGDRDPRTEDRQLLLDALLAATDHLVITYTGRDERTNLERPPAVPVGELLDVIDRTVRTDDGTRARDRVARPPPAPAVRCPQLHGRGARPRTSLELRSRQPRGSPGAGRPTRAATLRFCPARSPTSTRTWSSSTTSSAFCAIRSGPSSASAWASGWARASGTSTTPCRSSSTGWSDGELGERLLHRPHGRRRSRRLYRRRAGAWSSAAGCARRPDPRTGDPRCRGHRRRRRTTTTSRPRWTSTSP